MTRTLTALVLGLALLATLEAEVTGNSYTTTFPTGESPLSEGGRWINGRTTGLDWADVHTTPGLAFGTNSILDNFDDSTAVLSGTWGPDQTVTATVHTVNQQSGSVFEEVELRLRTTIAPHHNSGYEAMFRATHDGSQYVAVARWNGPLNDFTALGFRQGPGIYDGDVIKATISGNIITQYINGVVVNTVDITAVPGPVFTSGNPGIGFNLQGAPVSANRDFGLRNFTASDQSGAGLPSAPKNLRIVPQ